MATPEERITALEVKMNNLEKELTDMKTQYSQLLDRLSSIEKRIAIYTGGILAAGYLVEHLIKLVGKG